MKPIRFLNPLAEWLMRSGVVLFGLLYYLKALRVMNFTSLMFYVSFLFVVFSATLIIGGFLRKSSLTVISALILLLISIYQAIVFTQSGIDYDFAIFVLLGSINLHFLAKGNR